MTTDSSESSAHPFPMPVVVGQQRRVASLDAPLDTARSAWAALAPLLAARPRVRLSRDRGRTYGRRGERPLTTVLPGQPAAVPLYDEQGTTRVLVIDLDVSRGGRGQLLTDCDRLRELIDRCGGQAIVDESPTGGRHLYLPLTQQVSYHDARDLAVDLAAQTPSMDVKPNHNLTDGLIRPPGSVHPNGGHQTVIGPLSDAVAIATTRNPPAVWQRLRNAVPRRLHADALAAALPGDSEPISRRHGPPRPVGRDYLAIATTGLYDTTRYDTPSEARQAVITAAANAGLALTDVLSRLAGGIWPGLAAFYARYRPGDRARAVRADWQKATRFLAKHPAQPPSQDLVRRSPTSEPTSHPPRANSSTGTRSSPEEYQFIRTWWSALRISPNRWPGRSGLVRQMVLRAVGEAAMKAGSRYVAFGTRSLSIAAGVDHTTVAVHLRRLRAEPDPFIDLIEDDRGLAGDLYQLRIPDALVDRADRAAWPAGRMHALRPAFRELGLVAAAVYEALETASDPLTSFGAASIAGISRSAGYEALETLSAWNLAAPDGRGRWVIVRSTCLARLAEAWGVIETIRGRIAHHRVERAAYRRALRIPDVPYADIALAIWSDQVPRTDRPPPAPPPDPLDTALSLLQRELSATILLGQQPKGTLAS